MEKYQKFTYKSKFKWLTILQLGYFLLWPFGALITSIKNFRQPSAKTVFWFFCIFFGFVFISADINEKGTADSARYAKQLIDLHNTPISWQQLVTLFYNPDDGYTDIYQSLITWIIAIFTSDTRWLFAAFAMVFGYFYTQNLWIILSRIQIKISIVVLLYIFEYALVNPIWNINGVRMWTAAQVFLFGSLQYFLLNNKKGLLWCASSILFHFSFMFPVSLMIIFIFLPKNIHLFFIFYAVASFINEINLDEVKNILVFLPDVFQPKIQAYTDSLYHKRVINQIAEMNWYVGFAYNTMKWIIYSWIIILYIKFKNWLKDSVETKNLLFFALFLGGWAQISSLVPSGGRFVTVSNSIFYAIIIILLVQKYKIPQIGMFSKVFLLPLVVVIIFQIRLGFDYMGLLTIIGNPFAAYLFNGQIPLIEFVKSSF